MARDPYALMLAAAAAIQVALGTSSTGLARPDWAYAALVVFGFTCVLAVLDRVSGDPRLRPIAPFLLLVVAGLWRATDQVAATGFGALAIIAVTWLGLYGTERQVWLALLGEFVVVLVPPLVIGDGATVDDWRHLALTVGVSVLVGPTINTLVRREAVSDARMTALEPVGSQLDAVLRAATGNLIIATDRDGLITEFNAGAERMLGYPAVEIIGTCTLARLHDRDETQARAAELGIEAGLEVYLGAARLGEIERRDWTLIGKDGRRLRVALSITGMCNPAGEIIGYVAIGTDVTDTRAAMDALAAEREVSRLLIDHLPMTTVMVLDDELRCLEIGGHWLNRPGSREMDTTGRFIGDFQSDADRDRIVELFRAGRLRPTAGETMVSSGITFEYNILPVAGPNGQRLVLSVVRDVTERRQLEHERQRMSAAVAVSEATFRGAFEGAPIGITLTTVGPPGEERFLEVNPAAAALLGRTPEALVGMAVHDLIHADDLPPEIDPAEDVSRMPVRQRFIRPSGRTVWVDVSHAVVRGEDGEPLHIIKQLQDVGMLKASERALLDALEQQRAVASQLSELDKIRTELVATMSHELRTPLTSIHGYLALLADESLTDAQLSMVAVANRNAARLAALVDDLLVLIRLDADDSTGPQFTEVAVTAAVSAAVDTIHPEIARRGQHLELALPTDSASVQGDSEQLDRMLMNLLGNASKYTPDGGRIEVCVQIVGADVVITVGDTGIGIPTDEQVHLFTRFFRASSARAKAIGGTGLGLAIVKSIVELHGGQVGVESEAGRGSTFRVALPLATKPTQAAALAARAQR